MRPFLSFCGNAKGQRSSQQMSLISGYAYWHRRDRASSACPPMSDCTNSLSCCDTGFACGRSEPELDGWTRLYGRPENRSSTTLWVTAVYTSLPGRIDPRHALRHVCPVRTTLCSSSDRCETSVLAS